MRKVIVSVAAFVLLVGCISVRGGVYKIGGEAGPFLRHVIMFAFKDDVPQSKREEILADMERLPDQIPEILALEYGPDVSGRDLNHGFDYCAVFTFKDKAALDVYLPHPAHQAFVNNFRPYLVAEGDNRLLVFDYWTEN